MIQLLFTSNWTFLYELEYFYAEKWAKMEKYINNKRCYSFFSSKSFPLHSNAKSCRKHFKNVYLYLLAFAIFNATFQNCTFLGEKIFSILWASHLCLEEVGARLQKKNLHLENLKEDRGRLLCSSRLTWLTSTRPVPEV